MSIPVPHKQQLSASGANGAVRIRAAGNRWQAPDARTVRCQERRLTGAGARNPFQSVPVSFEFRLRGVPSTHAHRRRAVALLPEQLVAAISPAGRRCERSSCVPLFRRRCFHALHHVACKLTDAAPSHSTGLLSRRSLRPNRSDHRRPKSWKSQPAVTASFPPTKETEADA